MLKTIFTALPVCILIWCGAVSAETPADMEQAATGNYTQEWHLLPGESLNSLAALFYPKSKRMQQRFVAATIAMNREQLGKHSPQQPFEEGATITIPDIRKLSFRAGGVSAGGAAKRHAAAAVAKENAPATPGAGMADKPAASEYDALDKRNQEHTEKLAALNQRLKSLEDKSQAIKQSLAATTAALPAAAPQAAENKDSKRSLKRVQAPEAVTAPGESGLNVTLAILAAALLLIGIAGYRWHKSRSK